MASRDVIKRTAVLVSVAIDVQVLHRMDSSNSDSDARTAASGSTSGSNASESSGELRLSYSVSDAGSESMSSDLPDETVQPYLYEPVCH